MSDVYAAPEFTDGDQLVTRLALAQFVAVIAVILAFFASAWAWCWFVCLNYGGLRSCEVGWFQAKAICNR